MRLTLLALCAPLALLAGAAQAAVTAEQAVRAAPDKVAVTWTATDPVDVYVADRPDAALEAAKLVSADDRDGRFEMTADPTARPYFLLREKNAAPVKVAERILPLQQGSNFRDVGGYPAANGKTVAWGKIYRSGGTAMLTPADLDKVKALDLANMVDLRSDEERVLAPSKVDGVPYTAVGYSMRGMNISGGVDGIYRAFPTALTPQLKQVFAKLLRDEQPLAYNCSAGQDRTGFVTAMVLSALGTPRETIMKDYHLSTQYRRPQNEMPPIDAATAAEDAVAAMFAGFQKDPTAKPLYTADGTSYLAIAFDEIEKRWGSVDNYLKTEIGVGPAEITRLRTLYTE